MSRPFRCRRDVTAVAAGAASLIGLMLLAAGASLALGLIRLDSQGAHDLAPWLVVELIAGAGASLVAGRVARRLGGSNAAPRALAVLVGLVEFLEAGEILRHVSAGDASAPLGLVLLAPLVAAGGVLIGGSAMPRFPAGNDRPRPRSVRTAMAVAAPLAVLVAASVVAGQTVPSMSGRPAAPVLAAAAAFDLTVTAPALVYVLLVRARRVRWFLILPTFALGYALARALLPAEHHAPLNTLGLLVFPAEAAVLAWLVVEATRGLSSPSHGDAYDRLSAAARRIARHRIAASILATEAGLAFAALRPRFAATITGHTVHRTAAYGPVAAGLVLALLAETLAVHALVRTVSHAAAWALTASSLYAILWIIGDARALAQRRTTITAETLHLRFGLRWSANIPLHQIAAVERWRGTTPKGARVLALIGPPNLLVRLNRPAELIGMYGLRRRATDLYLRLDDPDAFLRAVPSPVAQA